MRRVAEREFKEDGGEGLRGRRGDTFDAKLSEGGKGKKTNEGKEG